MSAFACSAWRSPSSPRAVWPFWGCPSSKASPWGKLIQNGSGRSDLEDAPWIAFAPIIVLFLTVLSLNFAGDRLRSHFDVKESAL